MYTPIVATLGYVLSADKRQTLLVHRNGRPDDPHAGKYNGLGGKMEPQESIHQCICREIKEEAGIICDQVVLRGTINWTGFGPQGEDWFGFIYRIDQFTGVPFTSNEEGRLLWHPIERLAELPMWDGDRHFLSLVFDNDPRLFHGYMPYAGNKPLAWTFTRC
ncbi:MAG: 8-oxo-dGTP diphosphatase [Desulfofustis sp.]|nr:8-oxo-dGTP diphosphatase [Desulfofustis sp.]